MLKKIRIFYAGALLAAAPFCGAEFNIEKDLTTNLIPVELLRSEKNFGRELYHVCDGMPGILTLEIKINPAEAKKLEIIMFVPEGFSVIGAAPLQPVNGDYCSALCSKEYSGTDLLEKNEAFRASRPPERMSVEAVTRDALNYKRCTILADDCFIKQPSYRWRMNAAECVYIKSDSVSGIDTGKVYWRLRVNDSILSDEKQFEIRRLPRMEAPARPLERFQLMQYSLKSQLSPFPEVRDAYLSFYKSVHARPSTSWDAHLDNWAKAQPQSVKNDVTKIFDVSVWTCAGNGAGDAAFHHFYMPLLKKNPSLKVEWLVREDGKTLHSDGKPLAVCPDYLASKRSDDVFWNRILPEFINYTCAGSPPPTMFVWDYEPIPSKACFCENCRKEFKEFVGEKNIPSAEQIKTVFKKQWFDYQVQLHNKILAKFSAVIRARFPTLPFWVCSDPLHTDAPGGLSWCSLDPRETDKYADGHLPMPYYSGAQCFDDMALNVREMKRPVWEIIAPTCYAELFSVRYSPGKTFQNIIAAAATGNIGVGLYDGDDYDGLYFSRINDALRLLSKTENYYFGEKNDSLVKVAAEPFFSKTVKDGGQTISLGYPDQSKLRRTVFRRNGSFLLNLFNYDEANDCVVSVSAPSGAPRDCSVIALDSDSVLTDDNGGPLPPESLKNGFLFSVKSGGAALLEFRAGGADTGKPAKKIPQKTFREKFELMKAAFANNALPEETHSGKAAVSYGDIDKNTRPELRLDIDGSKVYVDFMGKGEIIGWRKEGAALSDLFNYYGSRGFCDQLYVYQNLSGPPSRDSFTFNVKNSRVNENGLPELTLTYKIPPQEDASTLRDPLEGLVIEKTVRLEEGGARLGLIWRFKNENPAGSKMPLALKLKTMPRFGGQFLSGDKKTIESVTQISFKTKDGARVIKSGAGSDNLFLADSGENTGFLKGKVTPVKWDISPVVVTAGNGGNNESFELIPDPDNTAGCYVYWKDGACYTVELLSKEVVLDKGGEFFYKYSIKRNN
jgi:hypothetical protein